MSVKLINGIRGGLLALVSVIALQALAIDPDQELADPQLVVRYEKLTDELRCLVCQNQSIADSDATLAKDLRRQVREMLQNGASDADIRDYMVQRYGDFVLFRPPWNSKTWLLWMAPGLLLCGGLGIAVLILIKRTRAFADDPPVDTSAES